MNTNLREQWSDLGSDVPDDWRFFSIEDLLKTPKSISVGVMYPGPDTPDGVPLIRVGDISNGFVAGTPEYRVSDQVDYEYRRTKLIGNELIMTLVGEPGECVIATEKMNGWNVARALAVLRLKDPNIRHWLRYVLHSRTAKHLIGARLNTTVQKTLNLKDIKELAVPIPPESVREIIEGIVGGIEEKIELNRKQNLTLEAIAQALFKRWFVEFEFPDENGCPYKSSGGAMQPSELGEIPVGWEVKPLSDVTAYLSRGITPAYVEEGGVMVLNQRCVRDGWINTEPARSHDVETRKIDGRELHTGDVLVNSTGMGTLGRVAQALALDGTIVVDSHITVVRADSSQVSPEYLGVCLRLKEREIEHMAEGSTGQTELSRAKLGELPVIVPDDGVLRLFTEVVADLNNKRALNWGESLSLKLARDTLLPKLMSGELRVA